MYILYEISLNYILDIRGYIETSVFEISRVHCVHVFSDQPSQTLPINGPWKHGSIKHMMQNVEEGKEDVG